MNLPGRVQARVPSHAPAQPVGIGHARKDGCRGRDRALVLKDLRVVNTWQE